MSALEKSPLAVSFLFFPKKQKIEHQTELNPVTYWTLNTWKAYLCPAGLNPVPVSALRKVACHFSLLAGFKAACVNLHTQHVSTTHHMRLPLLLQT
jgi:hypothetical protein